MQTWVGTSGFSYPEWRGSFYPEKMAPAKMLAYYAERLRAVEINNTFYRMPRAEMLAGWAKSTPDEFRFVPKAPQQVTHRQKLANASDAVGRFLPALAALGTKLGPILFQLPPFLRKDVPRLRDFLALLPQGTRAAFEFRHVSWFDDTVYQELRASGAALCIGDADGLSTPFVSTTGWGYLRLRRADYDQAALAGWAERVWAHRAAWDAAFVFFKHEEAGRGPQLAAQFLRALPATHGAVPKDD
ncbi:MAG: DUF72 domain-containing protein [Polyangia bacterium]